MGGQPDDIIDKSVIQSKYYILFNLINKHYKSITI